MTAPRKVNVDRMRRHLARTVPTRTEPVDPDHPEGSTVIRDMAGRVIRVLPLREGP